MFRARNFFVKFLKLAFLRKWQVIFYIRIYHHMIYTHTYIPCLSVPCRRHARSVASHPRLQLQHFLHQGTWPREQWEEYSRTKIHLDDTHGCMAAYTILHMYVCMHIRMYHIRTHTCVCGVAALTKYSTRLVCPGSFASCVIDGYFQTIMLFCECL